jgi:hypothetical protein
MQQVGTLVSESEQRHIPRRPAVLAAPHTFRWPSG